MLCHCSKCALTGPDASFGGVQCMLHTWRKCFPLFHAYTALLLKENAGVKAPAGTHRHAAGKHANDPRACILYDSSLVQLVRSTSSVCISLASHGPYRSPLSSCLLQRGFAAPVWAPMMSQLDGGSYVLHRKHCALTDDQMASICAEYGTMSDALNALYSEQKAMLSTTVEVHSSQVLMTPQVCPHW